MTSESAFALNAVASRLRRAASDAERLGFDALARELRAIAADVVCALERMGWLL